MDMGADPRRATHANVGTENPAGRSPQADDGAHRNTEQSTPDRSTGTMGHTTLGNRQDIEQGRACCDCYVLFSPLEQTYPVFGRKGRKSGWGHVPDPLARCGPCARQRGVVDALKAHQAPKDLNAPHPADDMAPSWHEARECWCCGDPARVGSLYCSDRCREIVEGQAGTDAEYRTIQQAEQTARWGVLDTPTPQDMGTIA